MASLEENSAVTLKRLNYIGSKYQLIEWLFTEIKNKTGFNTFENIRFGDLFSGTGIVSYNLKKQGAITISNDVELYSSIITHAFARSVYSSFVYDTIELLNNELKNNAHSDFVGFITRNYSPYEEQTRMFFTIDNAKRIDYLRMRIEDITSSCDKDDKYMLLASLLVSADNVANVPAVYGCYLKNFKDKAIKPLILQTIHTDTTQSHPDAKIYCSDILDEEFLSNEVYDIVYLDPPYNGRQYSKNYFPLNIIATSPSDVENITLSGVSGIPSGCFVSPLCQKRKAVQSFETIVSKLNTSWLFISYNSESIVSKDDMIKILSKFGSVSVIEKDYKRFKSFSYNNDKNIVEYLFCLKKK